MEKYQNFATNIFSSDKCDFFGDFGQKTGIAGPIIFKLSTKRNQVMLKKNLENENFMPAAVHCENWYLKKKQIFSTIFQARISNILKYFLSETICAQKMGAEVLILPNP